MLEVPLDAMQIRSLMASTEPNAQQEPQLAWSRISLTVGHFAARGSVRQSNSVGRSAIFSNDLGGRYSAGSVICRVPITALACLRVIPSKNRFDPAVQPMV